MAETYSTFVASDNNDKSMQLVVILPESKIGYTYPEVYFCVPTKKQLNYIGLDVVIGRTWCLDDDEQKWFIKAYTNGEPLTEAKWDELHIFTCSMKQLLEVIYNDIKKEEEEA